MSEDDYMQNMAERYAPPSDSEESGVDETEAVAAESPLTVRQSTVEQTEEESFQQTATGRITALPFALGFITLGVLLLLAPQIEGLDVTLPIAILILAATLVLTNLFRFFASGRRERGLFFLALGVLSLGAVIALMTISDQFDPNDWWPLVLAGIAVALLLTFAADRQHERGILGLSILFLVAAGVGLMVTLETIPTSFTDEVADYWPLAIAFIGITLIPLALRRSAG